MSMRTLNIAIGLVALLLVERSALGQWNSWTAATDVPESPADYGAAQLNGRSYLVCGWAGYSSSMNREFDPVTATWAIRANAQYGVKNPAGAAVNGEVVKAGGSGLGFFEEIEAYNPQSDSWRLAGTSSIVARGDAVAVAVDDRIHLLGGFTFDQRHQDHWVYWPASNQWAAAPSMPNCRGKIAGALDGRAIRVAGGDYWNGNQYAGVDAHELFLVDINIWVPQPSLPFATGLSSSGAMIGSTFVISYGGLHVRFGFTGGWEWLLVHPYSVSGARMQQIGTIPVVFSGWAGAERLGTSYEYYESAFFVDSQAAPGGNGTPNNPWNSFEPAIAASPGDPIWPTTIWARPGNYPAAPLLFDKLGFVRPWGGGGAVTIGQ